ncbi:MAG: hypothetical protein WAX04_00795 [Oscillospiraceae bacterium]
MFIYSYIEERYCTDCKKNVGIEYSHNDDGTKKAECLNKTCQKEGIMDTCELR